MATVDPALGFNFDFPEQTFRNGITAAMQMGAPPKTSLQAVFAFRSTGRTYSRDGTPLDVSDVRLDRDGVPLDPTIAVNETPEKTVKVDCAVEIMKADAEELPVGPFKPTKATVTLLDTEYAKVKGCYELRFNGDRYGYGYEPDGLGLFGVGIHTLVFYARDES